LGENKKNKMIRKKVKPFFAWLLIIICCTIEKIICHDRFIEDLLDIHNEYRRLHSAPTLKLNESLSSLAQNEAKRLAELGKLENKQIRYGEVVLGSSLAFISKRKNLTGKLLFFFFFLLIFCFKKKYTTIFV
jgi:predicted molibdopterin-dependent oxidoreductase YjgC